MNLVMCKKRGFKVRLFLYIENHRVARFHALGSKTGDLGSPPKESPVGFVRGCQFSHHVMLPSRHPAADNHEILIESSPACAQIYWHHGEMGTIGKARERRARR